MTAVEAHELPLALNSPHFLLCLFIIIIEN
jgi:hypothetical protein